MISIGSGHQAMSDLVSFYQQPYGSNWPHPYASVDFGLRLKGYIPPYDISDVNAELNALNLVLPTDFVLPTAWHPNMIPQPTSTRREPDLSFITQARTTHVPIDSTPAAEVPEIVLDVIDLEPARTTSTDSLPSLENSEDAGWQSANADDRLPTRHDVNISQNVANAANEDHSQTQRLGETTYLPPALWHSWYIHHSHFVGANDLASSVARSKAREELLGFGAASKPRDMRRQYLCYHCKHVCFSTFSFMNRHRMACPKQSKTFTNLKNL